MMRCHLAIILALLMASATAALAAAPPAIPVFVTSSGADGTVTDPDADRADSMRDLREAIAQRKVLRLVDAREKAAIVLTVLGREDSTSFWAGNKNMMRVELLAGTFKTVLSSVARTGAIWHGYRRWKPTAAKVAKDVERWALANRDKLDAPRDSK